MKIRGWTKTRQGIRKCRGPEHSRPVPFLSTLVYRAQCKVPVQPASGVQDRGGIRHSCFRPGEEGKDWWLRPATPKWTSRGRPGVLEGWRCRRSSAATYSGTRARGDRSRDPGKTVSLGRHGGASAVEGTVYEEPTRAIGSAEVTVGLPRSSRSSAGSLSTSAAFAQLHRYRSSRGEAISILVSGTWVGRRCNRTGPSGVLTQRVAL